MEKKGKIVKITTPRASKKEGFFYVFVSIDNGDSGAFFYQGELKLQVDDELTYEFKESSDGRTTISLPGIQEKKSYKTDYKVEALKMAVSSYNASKIEKEKIKDMSNYLLQILNQ